MKSRTAFLRAILNRFRILNVFLSKIADFSWMATCCQVLMWFSALKIGKRFSTDLEVHFAAHHQHVPASKCEYPMGLAKMSSCIFETLRTNTPSVSDKGNSLLTMKNRLHKND